jgi:hypothetical protein
LMKISALTIPLIFGIAISNTTCVSVNIGNHPAKHASGVTYTLPGHPFTSDTREDVDAAWKNPQNGNLISYLSDCTDDTDPTLDSIVQGSLGGLSDLLYESNQNAMILGREAKRVMATGKVDGVPTQIDLLVFKRNRCIYILSYVGVQKSFAQNHAQFDHFIDGFRAP